MNKLFISTIILLLSITGSLFAQDNHYLTFKKAGKNASKIKFTSYDGNEPSIYYSFDGDNWTELKKGTTITCEDIVYVKGFNTEGFSKSTSKYTTITTTNPTEVSGSVMSLIDGEGNATEIPCDYCFYSLFNNSKSLKSCPELNATKLKKGCYANMFNTCTNITSTPALPATTLEEECYQSMFSGCKKLTNIKALKAQELKVNCYKEMFKDCEKVDNLIVNFEQWVDDATTDWLTGTSASGIIICNNTLDIINDNNHIPENWNLVKPNYLKITALEDILELGITYNNSSTPTVEYSFDGFEWNLLTATNPAILPKKDDFIYLRGKNSKFSSYTTNFTNFTINKQANAEGSVMSLLDNVGILNEIPNTYSFYKLFTECNLVNANILTATKLKGNCYNSLFSNCINLKSVELPKNVELAEGCYAKMFSGCKSLNRIEVDFTDWNIQNNTSTSTFTTSWVENVSDEGIFICPTELSYNHHINKIPINWKVNPHQIIINDNNVDDISINNSADWYSHNEKISFEITAKTGYTYEVTAKGITSNNDIEITKKSFTMPLEDVELSVTYTPIEYSISKPKYIKCDFEKAYIYNTEIPFTVRDSTAKGYYLSEVTINNTSIPINGYEYIFSMADYATNITLRAKYELITYNITTDENCLIETDKATIKDKLTIKITDKSKFGYAIDKVYINDKTVKVNELEATLDMSKYISDVYVHAEYKPITYTITKGENISCSRKTATVEDLIPFSIKNLTSQGLQLTKVLINNKEIEFQDYKASLIMADFISDVTITAEYQPINYPITCDENTNCNYSSATVYNTDIEFTVNDLTSMGYKLTAVYLNKTKIELDGFTYHFSMADYMKEVSITAKYEITKYQITKDENISCRKTTATVEDEISFTIKNLTSSGRQLKKVLINSQEISFENYAASFKMKDYMCDVNITAEYELITFNITAEEHVHCNVNTATVESEPIQFTVDNLRDQGYELTKVAIGTKSIPFENFAGSFIMSDFAKDVTIKATYTPIKYNITKDENISCRKTTATVEDSVYFTIKDYSNIGLELTRVLINSKPIEYKKEKPGIAMKDYKCDIYISAEYQQLDYKITTDENCITSQQFANINDLIKIYVEDLSQQGYELEKIFVNGSSVTFYKNFCNFMMSDYKSDIEITTQYKPITYKVKTGKYVYTDQNTAIVTDTILFSVDDLSEEGKIFEGILVNGQKVDIKGFNDTIFMRDYVSDITIEAVYSQYSSIITDANITEISNTTAQKGEPIQFSIKPAPIGYAPIVYVNNRVLYSTDSINYSFAMFNNDVEIFVEYQEIIVEEPSEQDNAENNDPEESKNTRKRIINSKERNKIKIYPSPAREGEQFVISLENIDTQKIINSQIIIFNTLGKIVTTIDNPQEINRLTLSSGLYKGVFVSGGLLCKFDILITK